MNSVQASSYIEILKEGLKNIVAVNLHVEWQQQKFSIYRETDNALSRIPQFQYRLIQGQGLLLIDNRDIESAMPEHEASLFRTLIRAYTILVTTTRYADNVQFMTKRTKVLQLLNKPQASVVTTNHAMAINVRNETLYNLSQKPTSCYIEIIKGIVEFKRDDISRVLAVMRDRGRKADYVQTFEYEKQQVRLYVKTQKAVETWFDSIYLNWVLYEIENDINTLPTSFNFLFRILEEPTFMVPLMQNEFECYGCCMSLYTLLDKIFILHDEWVWHQVSSTRIKLLNLSMLASLMYINYHKQKDLVHCAEIYSSYARIFDRFREDMPVVLVELGDFSIRYWYYYCWGMANAMTTIPIEFGTRDDYRKSSFMMQQNGTVVGVTGDQLDASWDEAIKNGGILSAAIYKQLVEKTKKGLFSFKEDDKSSIDSIVSEFNKKNQELHSLNNIRCLERFYQLEPYNEFGKIEQPYFPPKIHYGRLLDNIGDISSMSPSIRKMEDGFRVDLNSCDFMPSLSDYISFGEKEYCIITRLSIHTDDFFNIKSIGLHGHRLDLIRKDVLHTGIFYGVPCKVGLEEMHISGLIDNLVLFVGTENDLQHGFSEKSNKANETKIKTPIPDAIVKKIDVESIIDWQDSCWEDYLELNMLSISKQKKINDLYDIVVKYKDDISNYYNALGFDGIPFNVFRDLISDPCLIYFIDYLLKGPELKAKAARIVNEYEKGYKELLSLGQIMSLGNCTSISDYLTIIDKQSEISQRDREIKRREEEENQRKYEEELNKLKKQAVEITSLYTKGYNDCIRGGYVKDINSCRTIEDYRQFITCRDLIANKHSEILEKEFVAERERQRLLLASVKAEVVSLKNNYAKGYNYFVSLGYISQPDSCYSIVDFQNVLKYTVQVQAKHRDILDKERQEILRIENERRLREERERARQEEQRRIAGLSTTFKSDCNQIRSILRENGIYCFYHFTDRANLASIKTHGGLYSWYYLKTHDIPIPNPGGNSFSQSRDVKFGLQDYVRLSFCEDHPMAYRKRQEGSNLVLLKISTDVAEFDSTLFTDANAASNYFNKGANASALRMVNFRATKTKYMRRDDPDFGHKQAEILIKTFLPAKYILNLNDL